MWIRADLKQRAKNVLKVCYWKAVIVCLILAIVGGSGGGLNISGFNPLGLMPLLNQSSTRNSLDNNIKKYNNPLYEKNQELNKNEGLKPNLIVNSPKSSLESKFLLSKPDASISSQLFKGAVPIVVFVVIIIFLIVFALVFAYRIFLGYPVGVGAMNFFVQASQNNASLDNLGFSFTKTRYMAIIKSLLWRDLFSFLWTLLFLLPGIVKSYAYLMVPYILADNPNIGYKRALKLSMQMTKGHKFNIFVLGLSFFWWYVLVLFTCGIGVLFLAPYLNATNAELYLVLRKLALEKGYCTHEELLLVEKLNVCEVSETPHDGGVSDVSNVYDSSEYSQSTESHENNEPT